MKDVTIQGTGTAQLTLRGYMDVMHSTFQNNSLYTAHAEAGSINVESSLFSSNERYGSASRLPNGQVGISNVDFFNNNVPIGSGGTVVSAGNNHRVANTTLGSPTNQMGVH